ncbi:MAG: hypothetical protein QOC99_2296 [Acidobacteriota bacterium]|jgi:uncharacterized repeat protein (TIGR01451 family)|nr:hypothetical protein [Acidobacteriota bacterium]MDT7779784.1 hypothetical protein [Acidobacteriota bacterium]
MTRLKNKWGAAPMLALCLVATFGVAAFAQRQLKAAAGGRPEVKVELNGSVERAGNRLSLDKVENVKPGEILDWQIVSSNEGSAAARDYKTVGHIPAGTALVSGSAAAESGSNVTYSIDGGKTFSTQPVVEERQADGSVKTVPAPVSMYTEVRYEWSDALAAGGKLSASYKVRVK